MIPLVQAIDVTKTYKSRSRARTSSDSQVVAVGGVSMTIAEGSTLGLVGESGSGKSTLGRVVLGLEPPTSGSVLYRGQDIAHLSPAEMRRWRRRVQAVFQDPYGALPHHMRVAKLLDDPYRIHNTPADDRLSLDELLAEVGLASEFGRRYPSELSGGQRQRVVIARALALRPELVVCDEPVSALDVTVQAQVLDLLRGLQVEFGLTYLFISHDLAVVRYMSNHIGVMYRGLVVESGPAEEVYENAMHPYTTALLAARPTLAPGRSPTSRVIGEPESLGASNEAGCAYRHRCPLATEVCTDEAPPLRELSSGRLVACHHADVVPDRLSSGVTVRIKSNGLPNHVTSGDGPQPQ